MINTGNTAFMLFAASLVMLMTPGLAFFYGGLVGRKNVLTIMMQSFVSMGWTTLLWVTVGFTMCFGADLGGIIGNGKYLFLHGITIKTLFSSASGIPMLVFVVYQMMFAIITPALITGAFTSRVKFKAYMIFLTIWQLFVYFPLVHMVWGGGFLQKWGVLDFGGGIVVHAIAGFSALSFVLFIGKRKNTNEKPHDLPLFTIGAALLWFGWFGFNTGNAYAANGVAANAFINTQIAAAFAAITWMFLDIIMSKKPKTIGIFTGALAGLVVSTPTAGFVSVQTSMLLGIIVALFSYFAILFKNKKGWDDALDVWGVHGIGGYIGILLLGIFATKLVNPEGANGLIHGNGSFLFKEFIAVTGAVIYAFLITYISLWIINKITPVKESDNVQDTGLDKAQLDEEAYIG